MCHSLVLTIVLIISLCDGTINQVPSIPLYNAADVDLRIPVVGLGTFGYNNGGNPEHSNTMV